MTTTPAPRCNPTCPQCGGQTVNEKQHTRCVRCGRICETCCEGGPQERTELTTGRQGSKSA